jgi:hypothetical protein
MNAFKKFPVSAFYFAGVGIGIACLVYNVESYDQNVLTAPRAPDARSGHVIAYNNHGTTVYLTRKQDLIERWGPLGWVASWMQSR